MLAADGTYRTSELPAGWLNGSRRARKRTVIQSGESMQVVHKRLNAFGGLRAVLLCLLALLTSVAPAQVSDFEGSRIVDIQFSPASPVDTADLDRVQPLKKGEPLRAQDVADAIDGLFSTGLFEDIVVEAERSG